MCWNVVVALIALGAPSADTPWQDAEQIFPVNPTQTHAPGIVECPNGDLIASWYKGSEDSEGDAAIWGARKRKGESQWSEPFLHWDTKGFTDLNTCMMIDSQNRLWLFWPTIIGGSAESAIMNYAVSTDYYKDGPPRWDRHAIILLKPADFAEEALKILGDGQVSVPRGAIQGDKNRNTPEAREIQKNKIKDPMYQRLGWTPRCKPTVLPSGRILLPLYTDTWLISIMAVSDDDGMNWYASQPLIGFGNIQPTVLRRNDGSLVAYMRENSGRRKIRISESTDDGIHWSPVGLSELPNFGSGIDGVRLANGHWALIYNDKGRTSLVVSISEDEGKTWKYTRHLEMHDAGRYQYPAVIQGKDGTIHTVLSTFIAPEKPGEKEVKGIKHNAFNEAWVKAGDPVSK